MLEPKGAQGAGASLSFRTPVWARPRAVNGPTLPLSKPGPLGTTLWQGLRIGLLGGSFNPAHEGHRYVSLMALRQLGLDQVWWLVSPQNPLKARDGMAPLEDRLAQAERIAAHPRLLVTAIETRLGTRFTADTLKHLTRRFPATRFVWLMGADNLTQIRHWQHWQRIYARTPVAVFAREPYSLRALRSLAAVKMRRLPFRHGMSALWPTARERRDRGRWVFLPVAPHKASATAIRAVSDSRDSAD